MPDPKLPPPVKKPKGSKDLPYPNRQIGGYVKR